MKTDDGEVGDKARFVRGVERAILDGEVELGVHSAKDLPGELPDGLALVGVPGREDPADAFIGAAGSLAELARGRPGRDREPAPRARSCSRCAPTSRSSSCAATSTPGSRSSPKAATTGSSSPTAGLARLGRADEISFRFALERDDPGAGPGLPGARGARAATTSAAAAAAADHRPRRR